MKKLLLVAISFFCVFSTMAQIPLEKPLIYIEKLDSIIGGLEKYRFEYDDQYNMKKEEIVRTGDTYYWIFSYDTQNRLDSATYLSSFPYKVQVDYEYDSLGRRSEETSITIQNDFVLAEEKSIYQYNENNDVSMVTTSCLQNGSWRDERKREYYYDDKYDIYEIVISTENSGTWLPNTKIVNTYDDYHNCKISEQYRYENLEWLLERKYSYYYDLSVSSSNIAGLDFLFYNMYFINGVNKFCRNKILYVDNVRWSRDGLFENSRSTHYYSSITGVNEIPAILMNVWPNPVDEVLNLEVEDLQQIEIFSLEGKLILTIANDLESINVSDLAKGCYLLKATMNNGWVVAQKFIKH